MLLLLLLLLWWWLLFKLFACIRSICVSLSNRLANCCAKTSTLVCSCCGPVTFLIFKVSIYIFLYRSAFCLGSLAVSHNLMRVFKAFCKRLSNKSMCFWNSASPLLVPAAAVAAAALLAVAAGCWPLSADEFQLLKAYSNSGLELRHVSSTCCRCLIFWLLWSESMHN